MAVRHGYGKIAGADALVFAYDTGDTRNSYRGEPTVNLLTSPDNMTGTGWSLGNVPAQITITGNQLDPFGKNNAILFTVAANGGDYPHIRQVDKITGTTASHTISIWAKSVSGSTRLDLVCFRSSPWNTAFSKTVTLTTEWQKFEVTGTPLDTTGHRIYFMCQNVPSGTATQVLMAYPQVEQKSHATPFVNGTRSATQGLLDLTSNNGLDLTDTTFNSSAEVDFDGTNGLMYSPELPILDSFTLDVVFKPDTVGGWMLYRNSSMNYTGNADNFTLGFTGGKLYGVVEYDPSGADVSVVGTSSIPTSQYSHGVFTYDNPTKTLKIYVNGELENTTVHSGDNYPYRSTKKMSIGADGGSNHGGVGGNKYFFNGQIPITKVYNRALTAAEIQNNFNNYKSRFNL